MSPVLAAAVLQCTPPGLIYGRAGELRTTNNKIMVLQVKPSQAKNSCKLFDGAILS